MRRRQKIWLVSVAVLAAGWVGASPALRHEPARSSSDVPKDRRLVSLYHRDAPWPFEPAFATRRDWQRRADEVRRQVRVALGLWPLPARPPLAPVIHGRIDRDDDTIEKVFFASLPGHYVTGNLYRPKRGSAPHPGVLSPHGHWDGGRMLTQDAEEVRTTLASGGERTAESAMFPLQAGPAALARLGFVVFIYDMVGYADSAPIVHREGFTDADAILRLQSFMGLQAWTESWSLARSK